MQPRKPLAVFLSISLALCAEALAQTSHPCAVVYTESFASGLAGWSSHGIKVQTSGGWDLGPYLSGRRAKFYPNYTPSQAPASNLLVGDLVVNLGTAISFDYYGRTFQGAAVAGPSHHWIFSDSPGSIARWRHPVPEGINAWSHITFTIDCNWTDAQAMQAGWSRFSTSTGTKSWRDTVRNVTSQTFYAGNCQSPCTNTLTHKTGVDDIRVVGLTRSEQVVRLGSPANPQVFLSGTTTGPIIGQTWDPVVDHTVFLPGAVLDGLILALGSANNPMPFGTILCDLAGPHLALSVTASTPFAVPIPMDCNLVGLSLFAQGLSADPTKIALANALDITLGTY